MAGQHDIITEIFFPYQCYCFHRCTIPDRETNEYPCTQGHTVIADGESHINYMAEIRIIWEFQNRMITTLVSDPLYTRYLFICVQLTPMDPSHTSGPVDEMSQGELSHKTATR